MATSVQDPHTLQALWGPLRADEGSLPTQSSTQPSSRLWGSVPPHTHPQGRNPCPAACGLGMSAFPKCLTVRGWHLLQAGQVCSELLQSPEEGHLCPQATIHESLWRDTSVPRPPSKRSCGGTPMSPGHHP